MLISLPVQPARRGRPGIDYRGRPGIDYGHSASEVNYFPIPFPRSEPGIRKGMLKASPKKQGAKGFGLAFLKSSRNEVRKNGLRSDRKRKTNIYG